MAPVKPYRLKTERAKRHIAELAKEIDAFKGLVPYEIIIDDTDPRQRLWVVRVKQEIPSYWSAIVGDAVHNIRSALDLLAVAVVRHCNPDRANYDDVCFVVPKHPEKFKSVLREKLKGASVEAFALFEKMKPYKGGDEDFWRLHQLDILDKHKALIPVAGAQVSFGMAIGTFAVYGKKNALGDVFDRTIVDTGHKILHVPMRKFPIYDGTIVLANPFRDPLDDKHEFTFEVVFGEGQIIDGEPVISALTRLCERVEGVFDDFEDSILK